MEKDRIVHSVEYNGYQSSIDSLLDLLLFDKLLISIKKSIIILKPNLLDAVPHPCTTDPGCIRAIINYINRFKKNITIIVLEGAGSCNTGIAYKTLGYYDLESIGNVKLMDVDKCELVRLENKGALVYKEIYLPSIIFEGFFVSVPTLKDHLLTSVTLGMKNLVGLLPEKYYGGYWSYKRSDVHRVGINNAIVDLNSYVKIDMTVIDGRIGQFGSHLPGGRHCKPEKGVIIGGYDALETDRYAAKVLGHDINSIKHLKLYNDSHV